MIKKFILFIIFIADFFHKRRIINFLHNKGYESFNCLFDIGAHKGESIKFFIKNFKIQKLYSFEPSQINFKSLEKNLKKIQTKNTAVKIENLALGSENKNVIIKHFSESSSSTINDVDVNSKYFKKKSFLLFKKKNNKFYEDERAKQIKLCDYIYQNKISKIDFLKIDTEGYEMNVLLGLENQLSKISIIMFEHHYDNMILKNYKFHDIDDHLKRNNFTQIYKYKMPFRKTFEYIYAKGNN